MNYKNTVSMVALCAGLAFTPVSAQSGETQAPIELKIKAQRLDEALNEFAQQAGFQILTFPDDMLAKTTVQLKGSYTYKEALDLLLDQTGLTYSR